MLQGTNTKQHQARWRSIHGLLQETPVYGSKCPISMSIVTLGIIFLNEINMDNL